MFRKKIESEEVEKAVGGSKAFTGTSEAPSITPGDMKGFGIGYEKKEKGK